MSSIQQGMKIGRWTVLQSGPETPKKEKTWLCRCECGTERTVLDRSLKSGGSQSCGCLRREKAHASLAHDLQGRTFGQLTVLGRAETENGGNGVQWLCRCTCGRECIVSATLLACGRKTSCGKCQKRNAAIRDITNQRFGRLTALYHTDERDAKGNVIWHCRCDCGTELDVSYNVLAYSHIRSCGCRKLEHNQQVGSYLTHVDGTSLDILKSKKIPVNNTTGVRGVYLIRGKYVAKMVFQKKQYFLGNFDSLDKAAHARREAEEKVSAAAVAHYEKWHERAQADPLWAERNPIKLRIERKAGGGIELQCLPQMQEKTC